MKAIRIHSYGGPEVLRYEYVVVPTPAAGELLIKVQAASVNPLDWKTRAGYLKDFFPHSLPFIPGWDGSGIVDVVGSGVTKFKKGDEVYAKTNRDGTYAEYAILSETEAALKPKSIDHVQAAAIPVVGLTAWQALFEKAQLAAGKKILIHGAAGGVGSFAVQLAKWKGAYVIGTASAKNQAFLRELGTDKPIDYEETRFDDAVEGVDVVFDTIGGDTQERSWKVLKKGGILVSIVQPPAAELAAKYGARAEMLGMQPNSAQLAEIAKLVDSGHVKVVVEKVLSLFEARQAHELSETGHVR
ncbi:MAG: NADP-dependent oxidoreductase, partial [Verrucomicrobia bacterium]|nr:NADP-dependent oxidoreductase [Verrucomicrobiota bacterium]